MFTLHKPPCDKADVLMSKTSHVLKFYDHLSCQGQQGKSNMLSTFGRSEEGKPTISVLCNKGGVEIVNRTAQS
jgi:hypothetical protein